MRPRPSLPARRARPRSGRSALAAPTDPNAPAPSASATAAASPAMSHDAGHSAAPATPAAGGSTNIPPGWTEHDVDRPERRPALSRQPRPDARRHLRRRPSSPSWPTSSASRTTTPSSSRSRRSCRCRKLVLTDALTPLTPELDGDTKVFRLTIDEIEQPIDELQATGRGARLQRAVAGPDASASTRATRSAPSSRTTSKETTGVHFHGVEFDDFFQDGVAVRDAEADRAGRDVHLRVHGQQRRAR